MVTENKVTEKATTKKTTQTEKNTTDKKTCVLGDKVCKQTKQYAEKAKVYVKANYKTPKFIAASAIITLLALACLFNCNAKTTKLHISKFAIVKEVIDGDESTYYLCKHEFSEGSIKADKYYISCKTQIIEN